MLTYIIDDDEDFELEKPLPKQYDLSNSFELEELAEFMCDDYYNNHNGWQNDLFPIKLTIVNDGKAIANFEVDIECQQAFFAHSIDDDDEENS